MYWTDLPGSELMKKVFSNAVKMEQINIFDIKMSRDGPTLIINFDLVNQLPDNPPPKWIKTYNRCRCGINCGGVSDLNMTGLSTEMIANIDIQKNSQQITINIKGIDFNISFKCLHVQLMGPSVYISD